MELLLNNIEIPVNEHMGTITKYNVKAVDGKYQICVNNEWIDTNVYVCDAFVFSGAVVDKGEYLNIVIYLSNYDALDLLSGSTDCYDVTPIIKSFKINGIDVHTEFAAGAASSTLWYQYANIYYNNPLLNLSVGDTVSYEFEWYVDSEHTTTVVKSGSWTITNTSE